MTVVYSNGALYTELVGVPLTIFARNTNPRTAPTISSRMMTTTQKMYCYSIYHNGSYGNTNNLCKWFVKLNVDL